MAAFEVELRPAEPADRPAVIALLAACLGWEADTRHQAFFAWKHDQNPFGPSPAWVALHAGRVVGYRTFVAWKFERGGESWRAVRAVDTATDPAHRGQGIFSKLTQHSLAALEEQGVDFVFNTPNDRSRPGYLKMGWEVAGRLKARFRPRSPISMLDVARASQAAEKWSEPTAVGLAAAEALDSSAAVSDLLASLGSSPGLHTARSPQFLAWRYGFTPLHYRVMTVGDLSAGMAIFRLRRRGPALEATLCELLVPFGNRRVAARLVRSVLAASGADYTLCVNGPEHYPGFLPLPRRGPILLCRDISRRPRPPFDEWRLSMGDIELF